MKRSSELEQRTMSPERFSRTLEAIQKGLEQGVAPGMVAGIWALENPDQIWVTAAGKRRLAPSEQPMMPETVFDLASVTKVMGTAALASILVDRRWIDWNTPVRSILPDFLYPRVNLSHLLSHSAGFVAWKPFWESLRKKFGSDEICFASVEERQREMRKLIFDVEPDAAPEARVVYSDISFLLLGFALEEVTGLPLDRAVRELVWEAIGLDGAFYRRVTRKVEAARMEEVAATENCAWRGGVLQGQVHDDNCWAMGGYAGHAGAFGTVRDVLGFARALFSWGYLSRRTLQESLSRFPTAAFERTLGGWDTPSQGGSSAGRFFSPRSVGHLGFTGTSLWCDPDAGLAVALLTNRVHPTRDNTRIREFRPLFHDSIRMDVAAGALR